MRIECPECGAKYTFDKPIPLDKKYNCRKCGAVVTFRQVADTKETPAQVPIPQAQPEIRTEVKREPQKEKPRPVKQEVTKKFTIGIVLIITSLAIGKLALVPLILFPASKSWRTAMIILYVCGWLLLIPGLFLAGMEGYRLVTHKYRHYKRKTVYHVKNGTRKAAHHTVRVAKKTGQHTVRIARNTKDITKTKNQKLKHKRKNYKHRVLKNEKKLMRMF